MSCSYEKDEVNSIRTRVGCLETLEPHSNYERV